MLIMFMKNHHLKKRKKTKKNIIKNENPVFNSNSNSDNLIIRLKKVNENQGLLILLIIPKFLKNK